MSIYKKLAQFEQHHIIMTLLSFLVFAFLFAIHGTPYSLAETCTSLSAGDLFKVPTNSAVYLVNKDMKRMYFPNSEVYHTWYEDFSNITVIPNVCVDNYPSGGGINFRPGSRLVKTTISPNVYAVGPGNMKHKIASEEVAKDLYGENWASVVRDLSDVFDANLDVGSTIQETVPHNGQVVREVGTTQIYVVSDGKLKKVKDSLRNSQKNDVRDISQAIFSSMTRVDEEVTSQSLVSDPAQDNSNVAKQTPPEVKVAVSPKGTMTFLVTVPENTPAEDSIYIHLAGKNDGVKMDSIGNQQFTKEFSDTDVFFNVNSAGEYEVSYRYSRNGEGFATADYLENDTLTHFTDNRGRKTVFANEKTQTDEVERWRWFPSGAVTPESIQELGSTGNKFPDRDGKVDFHSGQGITDYVSGTEDTIATTAKELVAGEYNWAVLYPSWDWEQTSPLPVLRKVTPDDILKKDIRALKAEGLKVLLGPKACCTDIDFSGHNIEWYKAYFDEIREMTDYYSKLALEEGVDKMFYTSPIVGEGNGSEVINLEHDRMTDIVNSMKSLSGVEVGLGVSASRDVLETQTTIPEPDYISWGKLANFFYLQIDEPLSLDESVGDTALQSGVNAIISGGLVLKKYHNKSIWFEISYLPVDKSWKGKDHYGTGKIPTRLDSEEDWQTHSYSEYQHARVVDAFITKIKDSSWAIGLNHIGYSRYEMPLLPDYSVRGKAADSVWRNWNSAIFE